MASKVFSFRLPPEIEELIESKRKENETSNQALQREVIEFLKSGLEVRNDAKDDIKEEINEIVETKTLSLQKRIEKLEGKLKA